MIGWQDSDHDGVFDVLDVPLSFTGTGYYDAANHLYRFAGHSAVETLANENSAGRRNDITINEVSQAVYSLDGGLTWMVARNYNQYQADVNLAIPIQAGQEILIRTQAVDPLTGRVVVTSDDVFWGTTEFPTSVAGEGIQGHVWYDKDNDGVWDSGERGVPGWTMQLVDGSGQPLQLSHQLDPDDYEPYTLGRQRAGRCHADSRGIRREGRACGCRRGVSGRDRHEGLRRRSPGCQRRVGDGMDCRQPHLAHRLGQPDNDHQRGCDGTGAGRLRTAGNLRCGR